ncbi:MAG: exodeoxyribonuclease V subunit gamma [Desulfobacterales bacterium]|nr:exodeoxyribonuclease V subunit gamma [Desulfobacterales bacterium]
MPGLTIHTSNRLEILAEKLARTLRRPGDPLEADIVVVQSRGMERWLSLALARLNGIAANGQFPFPNAFIESVFKHRLGFEAEQNPFERNALTFRILRLLPDLVKQDEAFGDLRLYLAEDTNGVKGLQLAAEIADLLDQYLIFRPRMVLDWEKRPPSDTGEPLAWQPKLWRRLTAETAEPHRASLWKMLIETPTGTAAPGSGLPEHVSLFGVSYLPPYYLQILQALATEMTVDIYQLTPCQEYWADIASDREMAKMRRGSTSDEGLIDPRDLHLESGNRLLASMGGHGREFHTLVGDLDCLVEDHFEDVVPDTRLRAVQHDLLHLSDRGADRREGREPRHLMDNAERDRSIQIHACHGPMREIEVLRDQLLALLDANPEIEPRDILVMTPDIDTYAPYIQAVFGAPTDERLYLPFSIADRCLESASPLVEAFLRLLDLRAARFGRSHVLALIEFEPLRARFGFDAADLAAITEMLDRVGIRWGLDGADKARWDLPADDANTWRQGLDRLVLGYALAGEPDRLFQHLLPDDGVQGSQADLIGRFNDLIETLAQFSRTLDDRLLPGQWHRLLVKALTQFFVRDERFEYDFQTLERLLGDFRRGTVTGGYEDPVDLDVVRAYLTRQLAGERYRGGFIAGGMTFGALLPMRSIPAKIVCLVGLNHDVFPRLDRPRSFDRMALEPRLGDRSRRDDDRYLFLEALLSAHCCLYISYTGFDLHDHSVRPPSVVVSELIDYLQEGFGCSEADLVVEHRLQAFSPAYFQPEATRHFSYDRHHARSARKMAASVKERPEATPFLAHALDRCPDRFLTLTPDDLLEALVHPCRFLLERRLEVYLRASDQPPEDREAFDLTALEQFREGQWLTSKILAGVPLETAHRLQQARGVMPPGETGQAAFRRLAAGVETFTDRIRPFIRSSALAPRRYEISLDPFRLAGRIETLYPEGPVIFRYSRANGRALTAAWLQHLVFCQLAAADKQSGATVLICRDEVRRFEFLPDSDILLGRLLDLYYQAAHRPLAIFPKASPVFARTVFENEKPADKALRAARKAWEGHYMSPGDKDDPYIALGFRGHDPWAPEFETLASELFKPLFAHSEAIA